MATFSVYAIWRSSAALNPFRNHVVTNSAPSPPGQPIPLDPDDGSSYGNRYTALETGIELRSQIPAEVRHGEGDPPPFA